MTEPAENVHALFTPNPVAMLNHLEHLFGGYLDGFHDGLIELAWTDRIVNADGRYPLRHAQMFGTDQFEELIAQALHLNTQPMCNVYIGAALRKPDTFPGGRASASDILALTCAYVDLDDKGAAGSAKPKYALAKPTKVVVTGQEPHTRAQMWWRLDEPITDPNISQALLKGIAKVMGGDPSVSDPPRVMRLAGSIAWPMKPDRKRPELTFIVPLKEPGLSIYTVEHLAKVFPFIEDAHQDGEVKFTTDDGILHNKDTFGLEAKVADGRERYMMKTANAVLIQLIGETGRVPTAQELFNASWEQYKRGTDFTRPGRGQNEYAAKCVYTVKRFLEGKIKGCETIEIVQALYRQRQQARQAAGHRTTGSHKDNYDYNADFKADPPGFDASGNPLPLVLTAEQFNAGFTPPAYLIDGILQRGYLYSLTARTGHGKTAVAMYIAQCIARGEQMHGRKVKPGTVLLLAGENPDDIRARFLVLAEAYGFDADAIKMRFVAGVIDIAGQYPVIAAAAQEISDLVLVIVDTAAAYFLGDETNSNAQQGAYARMLRHLTFLPGKPAVLVNCHPIKNASQDNLLPMGGSAFVNEVDGNLTLWADAERQTMLHWLGKFRGPEFDPMSFELKVAESSKVHDAEGRLMPNVVAVPIAEATLEAGQQRFKSEENIVLHIMVLNPGCTFKTIATKAGFVIEGRPNTSKVQRLIKALVEFKFLVKYRQGEYHVTEKGKKRVGL